MTIDWDTLLKGAGLVGPAVGWLYQVRSTRMRSKIKADLEILEKAKAVLGESEATHAIAERIRLTIARKYPLPGSAAAAAISQSDLVFGVVSLTAALAWAVFVSMYGPWWRFGVTAALGVLGVGGVMNGLAPDTIKEDNSKTLDAPSEPRRPRP